MMNHTPISMLNTTNNNNNKNMSFNDEFKDKPNYYLVNKYPELSIIKDDTKMPDQTLPRVTIRDFKGILKRRDFVTSKDPPHEKRFDPPDTVVKNPQTIRRNDPSLSLDR